MRCVEVSGGSVQAAAAGGLRQARGGEGGSSAGAAAIGYKDVVNMAVIIENTQVDYGTAGDAGDIIFSEPFAATPAIVSSAGVAGRDSDRLHDCGSW